MFSEEKLSQTRQKKQSLGIKYFYSNTLYSSEHQKTASVNYVLKCSYKTKAVKAYAYRMLEF